MKPKILFLLITMTIFQVTIIESFSNNPVSLQTDNNIENYPILKSISSPNNQSDSIAILKPKWVWMGSDEVLLSLKLGDFNDDKQIDVVTGASSTVFAVDGRTGQTIWNNTDPVGPIFSLSVGDLDGDGNMDVVAGGWDQNITALQGNTGKLLWKFGGEMNETTPQNWIRTTDIADFNGDGIDDVIAGSDDWHIYCINGSTGNLLWRRPDNEIVMNIPYALATGDIDNDSIMDIVIGDGSNVYGYRGLDGALLWNNNIPSAPVRSLIVANINNDHLPEIVVASADGKIYVLEGYTGKEVWRFTAGGVIESIALGDFKGDGVQNDILVGSYNNTVYAINGSDGTELWRNVTNGWIRVVKTSDINNDGFSDAIIGAGDKTIYLIDGKTSEILTTISTINSITELVVTDVESDGYLDIIFVDGIALRCFTMGGQIPFTEITTSIIPTPEFVTTNITIFTLTTILLLLGFRRKKK